MTTVPFPRRKNPTGKTHDEIRERTGFTGFARNRPARKIPSGHNSLSQGNGDCINEPRLRFKKSVMQYSQYCRGPAEEAGRAKHEIPARSGSTRSRTRICRNGKFESSGHSPKATSWERRLSLLRRSSVSGGPAAAKTKSMRAPRPQTPRQVKITCTPANLFAVFENSD